MQGPVTGAPFLDGLLGFVAAQRLGLVAGFGPLQDVAIPIEREPAGRFYLASSPQVSWDQREQRYIHRRFPLHEAQMLGDAKLRRVHIGAGACRSYRIPGDVAWAKGDAIRWWCVGDKVSIEGHLIEVRYLGKRRAVGRGIVDRWEVEPCEPWPGFPVTREGQPLRPLPLDWPDLAEDVGTGYHVLSPPYYRHTDEVLCAVP